METHSVSGLASDSNLMKKMDSNDSDPLSPFQKLTLKHKTQSMPAEPISSSKKKIDKQKFGDIHNRWFEAVKLVEDIALSSVDPNSI